MTYDARDRATDDGTASLELVMLAPMLMAMMMMIIAFGRYAQTENLVDQASRDAARAATAQNQKSQVGPVIDQVVSETMADAPDSCRTSAAADPPSMTATAFGLPDPNDPLAIDSITVRVHCTLNLSDLAGLPLEKVDIDRTFTSPLDRDRGYR